jgi:hypothetical protein
LVYDSVYHTFPVEEHILIGENKPELVMRAEYERAATALGPEAPWGFGVVTRSIDFNGNRTDCRARHFLPSAWQIVLKDFSLRLGDILG